MPIAVLVTPAMEATGATEPATDTARMAMDTARTATATARMEMDTAHTATATARMATATAHMAMAMELLTAATEPTTAVPARSTRAVLLLTLTSLSTSLLAPATTLDCTERLAWVILVLVLTVCRMVEQAGLHRATPALTAAMVATEPALVTAMVRTAAMAGRNIFFQGHMKEL